MISAEGHSSYSSVQEISFTNESSFRLQAINAGISGGLSFRLIRKGRHIVFSLLNLNGNKVAVKSTQLSAGIQTMQMDNRPLKSGIYVLIGENGNQKTSTKVMVL